MSKRSNLVFKGLHIVAWVIFVGLCIEAGALIVNFIYSLFKPIVVHNLYQKLDLSEMYHRSKLAYTGMYGFILIIAVLKSFLFYVVILVLSKLDLSKPFNSYVAGKITLISYCTLSIGLFSYVGREIAGKLQLHGFETGMLNQFWTGSQAFILMAAVMYVIAVIFSKGVEIQNENDLTV